MVTINTNLSSLIVQNNLTKSTSALNQAIERMTTGFKINHASDNAANYSISQNMSSQISSYMVAQDNIAMGLDMVTTAEDSISLMQSHAERIMNLWNQAQNGTYGEQSMQAIQSEVNARMDEITRLYNTTEYNGINLFDGIQLPDWAQEVKANAGANVGAQSTGFIDDIVTVTPDVIVTDPTQLASAISSNSKIGIGDAATLRKLAELVNSGTTCIGKTILLTEDIDLSAYQEGTGWTPIGTSSNNFQGTFDGQGHKITNLRINAPTFSYRGLFGRSYGEIKNVGVVGAEVDGIQFTGALVGYTDKAVTNCYATGSVNGQVTTGGLVGFADKAITNCYASCSVTGQSRTGGLVGTIRNAITNCYATGSVTGQDQTGGLVGSGDVIKNSYASGSVTGQDQTGGLVGLTQGKIMNSYATGSVKGRDLTGGLAGVTVNAITNSYATGSVSGNDWIGGLVGQLYKTSGTLNLDKLCSAGTVSGNTKVGSLIGGIVNTSNGTSFGTVNITNASAASQGDMIGFEGKEDGTGYESGQMATWLENISSLGNANTTLQVGINGGESNQITFGSNFNLNLNVSNIKSVSTYDSIKSFMDMLSDKATELGAVSNRLESALESSSVAMENLVSSRSTLRDADIAKESSSYIKAQILQQASATLLATANQSPAIALQLL